MAIVTYGPIVSDARKKLAGVVFTKGHSGALVRKKVSPIQPRSQYQTGVRANFTANSKNWSSVLTAAQRTAWNALAATVTRKNKLGQSHTLTGLQLYQELNRNLATIGVSPISTPPSSLPAEAPGTLTLAYTPPTPGPEALTLTPSVYPDSAADAAVYATAPISVGKTFVGARYRFIGFFPGPLSAPIALLTDYNTKFGAIPLGTQIAVALKYINNTIGSAGTRVTVITTT